MPVGRRPREGRCVLRLTLYAVPVSPSLQRHVLGSVALAVEPQQWKLKMGKILFNKSVLSSLTPDAPSPSTLENDRGAPQAKRPKLKRSYAMDGLDPRWRVSIAKPRKGKLFCYSRKLL